LKSKSSLGSFWSAIIGDPITSKTVVRGMQKMELKRNRFMLCTDLILFFDILLSRHDKASSNMIWYFFQEWWLWHEWQAECDLSLIITLIFWEASEAGETKYMEKHNVKSIGTISENCMPAVCFCIVLSAARITIKIMQCKLSISQLILDNWDKPVERFRKKSKDIIIKIITFENNLFKNHHCWKLKDARAICQLFLFSANSYKWSEVIGSKQENLFSFY